MSRVLRHLSIRIVAPIALLALSTGLGGCVNQNEYDKLHSANRALEDRNVALQQEVESKENTIRLLRERVNEGDSSLAEARRRNEGMSGDMVRLKEDYRQFGDRLNQTSLGLLDPTTDRALRDLAAKHPNLISYDAARGMVQFASDLTFASGSTEVKPEARTSLQTLGGILTGVAAAYDVRIVGHTDGVVPSRPETIRNHPTNMHLAVHRSISVRDALASMGVPNDHMEVAGWGPYRPAVATNQAEARNRRVEIFLVPSSRGEISPGDSGATQPAAAVPEQPMK